MSRRAAVSVVIVIVAGGTAFAIARAVSRATAPFTTSSTAADDTPPPRSTTTTMASAAPPPHELTSAGPPLHEKPFRNHPFAGTVFGQAAALAANGDNSGARALLDPIVLGEGRAEPEEVRLLQGICTAQHDKSCSAAISRKYP
jgi:hypothetical protein